MTDLATPIPTATSGRKLMVDALMLAEAALKRDALLLRSLVQDLERSRISLEELPPPDSTRPEVQSCAASLVELLASRRGEASPEWTRDVPVLSQTFFLVAAAETMPRLRKLCEEQSPEPLRKRGLLAPPDFLTSL
jgi:hypothetical protein